MARSRIPAAAVLGLAACLLAGCGSEPPNVRHIRDEMDKAVSAAEAAQTVGAAEEARKAAERLLACALPGSEEHEKAIEAAGRMAELRARLLGRARRPAEPAPPETPKRRAPLTVRSAGFSPPPPPEPEGPAEPVTGTAATDGPAEPVAPANPYDAPFKPGADAPAVTVRGIEKRGNNLVCYIGFVNKTERQVVVGAVHADFFSERGRAPLKIRSQHRFLRAGFAANWTNVELSAGQRLTAESLVLKPGESKEFIIAAHSTLAKRVAKARVEVMMPDGTILKGEGP